MVQSERYLIFIDKYILIGIYKGNKNMFCVFTQAQEYDEDAKLWFKLGTIYLNNDKILSVKNVKGLKEYKKIIIQLLLILQGFLAYQHLILFLLKYNKKVIVMEQLQQ